MPGRGHRLPRPIVPVTLRFSDAEAAQRSLIDTGAPRTVFPLGVAIALGLDIPDEPWEGPDFKTHTFLGSDWPAFSCRLTLTLPPHDDLTWEAEVDFVLVEGLRLGLLGCEGFLDRWAVSFNASHTYTIIEPIQHLHQRLPIDVFELWQDQYPEYN